MGNVAYMSAEHGSDEAEAYFAAHTANGSSHVIHATAIDVDGMEHHQVFSTLAKARAWANKKCGERGAAVFSAHVIDVPEFGNLGDIEKN